MLNKTDHSITAVKGNFPYQHRIDDENKINNL